MLARMFDLSAKPRSTPQSDALMDRILAAARAEKLAAAVKLAAIGELCCHRMSLRSQSEDWTTPAEAAVIAEWSRAMRTATARGTASQGDGSAGTSAV
jgi:hypothetical protein